MRKCKLGTDAGGAARTNEQVTADTRPELTVRRTRVAIGMAYQRHLPVCGGQCSTVEINKVVKATWGAHG